MKKDLKSLSYREIEELVVSAGGKAFHAGYIFSFLHSKDAASISDITPIAKSLREKLANEGCYVGSLVLADYFTDIDGTKKYVFETFDNLRIESVLLKDNERQTLCISTQVGCRRGCKFCATAKLGFIRNLTAGEIVDQLYQASRQEGKIGNVVYMGMGEPFDNYTECVKSAKILNSAKGRNIGARHITVSTCGIAEKILDFASLEEQFRLAISLHSVNEAERTKLMPANKKHTLKDLLEAVKAYNRITGRRVTFEYCLIKEFNDSRCDAEALAKKLRAIKCNINLIEYNPHPGSSLEASGRETILKFQKILNDEGFETQLRFKRGENIKAACGQLGLLGTGAES